jgi:hypothetical protein
MLEERLHLLLKQTPIESGSDDLLDPGLGLKVDGHEGQHFRRFYPELIEPVSLPHLGARLVDLEDAQMPDEVEASQHEGIESVQVFEIRVITPVMTASRSLPLDNSGLVRLRMLHRPREAGQPTVDHLVVRRERDPEVAWDLAHRAG